MKAARVDFTGDMMVDFSSKNSLTEYHPNMDSALLKSLLIFSAVFVSSAAALLIARKIAFGALYRWARKTDTQADDIILDSVSHPSLYWALAIGLYIALDTSDFQQKYVNYGLSVLHALIIFSVTMAVANISSSLVQNAIRKSAADLPVTGLSKAVIKGFIFALGFLMILNSLGVSITPILTALGVGGLAVALALQDTLSNLFAGVHILIESSIRVGDYIRLSTGEEGTVADIGWRTTRIRQLSNNIVIIPNNKLSQSVITNFSLPEKRMGLSLTVGVGLEADPERVEKVLLEEAVEAASAMKGILKDPAPSVKLTSFSASSLDFTVSFSIEEYTGQFDILNELRKRVVKRLKAEGIELPQPMGTIQFRK